VVVVRVVREVVVVIDVVLVDVVWVSVAVVMVSPSFSGDLAVVWGKVLLVVVAVMVTVTLVVVISHSGQR